MGCANSRVKGRPSWFQVALDILCGSTPPLSPMCPNIGRGVQGAGGRGGGGGGGGGDGPLSSIPYFRTCSVHGLADIEQAQFQPHYGLRLGFIGECHRQPDGNPATRHEGQRSVDGRRTRRGFTLKRENDLKIPRKGRPLQTPGLTFSVFKVWSSCHLCLGRSDGQCSTVVKSCLP